jgi:trigger factor
MRTPFLFLKLTKLSCLFYSKINTEEVELLKSVEDINPTKKRLKIEIPADIIETEIKSSLEKLRDKVKIPGFRPGKAPVTLIEKRFAKEVEAEVLEKVVPEHLSGAIREAAINPVTMPVLDEEFQFHRHNPITLSVTVEIMPEIGNLNYENITIKDMPVTVEEADVEDALKGLRERKAVFEAADKIIEMDDFVTFEYVDSEITGGGDSPSAKEIISKMGNEIFPPDIMEKVIGKRKGDIVEFTAAFEKNISKELAGKSALIKVKISEVKKKSLPEIDDEFAKDFGYADINELREKVKEKIDAAKQEHVRKMQKAQILDTLLTSHSFEVPETLVQKELEAIAMQKSIADSKREVGAEPLPDAGESSLQAESTERREEDPQAELLKKAAKNVRASFLIDAIGKKEGITVSDDELNQRISSLAQKLSATPEAIRNFYQYREGSLESLKQSVFEDKVMDMLLSKAAIEKENG